jgi:hypothetical protein
MLSNRIQEQYNDGCLDCNKVCVYDVKKYLLMDVLLCRLLREKNISNVDS